MGYRHERPRSSLRDAVEDTTLTVHNGSTSDFAFPCFYLVDKDDETGACTKEAIPINLIAEGYNEIQVAFSSDIAGLVGTGYIDPIDDYIVRVRTEAFCPSAVRSDVKVHYSVTAVAPATAVSPAIHDVIATGDFIILHAPFIAPV